MFGNLEVVGDLEAGGFSSPWLRQRGHTERPRVKARSAMDLSDSGIRTFLPLSRHETKQTKIKTMSYSNTGNGQIHFKKYFLSINYV